MQPSVADQAPATGYTSARLATFSNLDRAKIALIVVLLAVVWGYARFSGAQTAIPPSIPTEIGTFAMPVDFVAVPGANLGRINLRAGPGAEYRVLEMVNRGTHLTGVARVADTNGATWIQLANNRGYAKETVVRVAADGGAP